MPDDGIQMRSSGEISCLLLTFHQMHVIKIYYKVFSPALQ